MRWSYGFYHIEYILVGGGSKIWRDRTAGSDDTELSHA